MNSEPIHIKYIIDHDVWFSTNKNIKDSIWNLVIKLMMNLNNYDNTVFRMHSSIRSYNSTELQKMSILKELLR